MKYCSSILLLLLISAFLFSQEGSIDKITIPAPSIDSDMPLSIYTPPGYSFTNDTPYRLYIYLHGAIGSVEWDYAKAMQPFYDEMINAGEIDPIVVVFPVLKMKTVHGKEIPYDLHFFTDSERNGNYASAITADLLEWLPMWYNITSRREERAIGGFSMGACGSLRIAVRNSDMFVACAAHDGNPDLRAQLLYRPFLLEETDGPPYHFDRTNGYWSTDWFAFAAAFAPNMTNPSMPDWFFDFPLDSLGNVIDSVFYDKIMTNHDVPTMMKNPSIYTNDISIFLEGSWDSLGENDIFHNELVSMGVPHVYELVEGHGLHIETIRSSMKFIDNAMDEAVAQLNIQNDVAVRQSFDRVTQLNIYSNGKYKPTAITKNMGSAALSQIKLTCDIMTDDVTVYSENITINSLPSGQSEAVTFPAWVPDEKNEYDVKIYSTLATDQYNKNDTLKTRIAVSNLIDDFESGLTNWSCDHNWETIAKDSLGDEYCVGHTPYFNYDNNCDSWLISKNSFDFSRLKSAELQFQTRYLFADDGDFGVVNVSLDDGDTWTPVGDTLKGMQDAWQPVTISLNDFSGPGFDNVWLGFQMITNETGQALGWFLDDIALNVEEYSVTVLDDPNKIDRYSLSQNYPNPFNPSTTLCFTIAKSGFVKLKIYNLLGEHVETLINEKRPAGEFKIEWDASQYPSGLYFCRLQADGYEHVRKLILQK
jgi:hypothetical protein